MQVIKLTIEQLQEEVIKRTLRVPIAHGFFGDSKTLALQLDATLMSVGFKMSKELLEHLSDIQPHILTEYAQRIFAAVRKLVGDHVAHNVYFRDFPFNVPDTLEFWLECLSDALQDDTHRQNLTREDIINLLDLPRYGRYQHTYEQMLAAHERFMPSINDRMTVLNKGRTLLEETTGLYHSLGASRVPLNESDRIFLGQLAYACLTDPQPESIPVRENRAIINAVRIQEEYPLLVDTCTDVLRLACALANGDVTLEQRTKFKSFSRKIRAGLMEALNRVIEESPAKLADVNQYREMYKRLGERVHPHEFNDLPHAQSVFGVARGDNVVTSLAGRVERAFNQQYMGEAISLLAQAPGMLFRNIDRILRMIVQGNDPQLESMRVETLLQMIRETIHHVSGRVILSLREHLQNRLIPHGSRSRIFANTRGTAWVAPDTRIPLDPAIVKELFRIFDAEILRRLPARDHLLVDQSIMNVAIPLSNKYKGSGFGIMPRGSLMPVGEEILRFFVYWKQKSERTDYDLSVVMLDEDFEFSQQVSWTNLRANGAVHSGDIVQAHNGASEFIDIHLESVPCSYIVPSVNIYAGEDFLDIQECFFGFMERAIWQEGKPFEPATVRMKSDMRGKGKVAFPLAFFRNDQGKWVAKWLHLYLKGMEQANRVERNRVNMTMLARSIIERQYLTVAYLVNLMEMKSQSLRYEIQPEMGEPVTYIGLGTPEGLPAGSQVYTLANLGDIIPA